MVEFFQPRLSYIICTAPRTGSWLLAEGLQSSRIAGRPREWFHKVAEKDRSSQWGMPLPSDHGYTDYVARMLRAATTPNGVFGLKLHWYQFQRLPEKLGTIEGYKDVPMTVALPRLFPNLKLIWLTRRNKIRQAISLMRARQTGSWWHPESYTVKRPVLGQAVFDPRAIDGAERHLLENDTGWKQTFEEFNAKPMVVVYEDLVVNYEPTVREVLRYLGIPGADRVAIPPTKMKVQSDGMTDAWFRRYLDFKQLSAVEQEERAVTGNQSRTMHPVRWKRLLAENLLQGKKDSAVVEVLVNAGVTRPKAELEVVRAHVDPYLRGAESVVGRMRRAEMLVEMYRSLAATNPHFGQVERRPTVSPGDFLREFYSVNRPVILTGLMQNWQARSTWSPESLRNRFPEETVEIMLREPRKNGQQAGAKRIQVRFADLLDRTLHHSTADSCCLLPPDFLQRPAVRPIFDDLSPWPEFMQPEAAAQGTTLIIEPSGYTTPMRHEMGNVMVAQISGKKRFKLVPPYERNLLYAGGRRVSQVNPFQPDLARHPRFQDASPTDVDLEPGEMLFLPVGWWHCEQAAERNLTLILTSFSFPNQFDWGQPHESHAG